MAISSVQELLAASRNNTRAPLSPFLSLVEGAAQGYGESMANAPERMNINLQIQARQVAMEQAKQDFARKAEAQKDMEAKLRGEASSHATGLIDAASVKGAPVTARAKTITIETDANGNKNMKEVYEDAPSSFAAGVGGPETIVKDGREYQVVRDAKGGIRYQPLQPMEKPIPSEAVKTGSLAAAGLRAIGQIRGIIKDPENAKRMFTPSTIAGGMGGDFVAAVTGDTQSQIMSNQIAEAGDALARLRTGAAISVAEEARYGKLLKGRFKTAAAYENALSTVEAFLNQVQSDLDTGRRKHGTAAPSAPAKPAPVKKAVEELSAAEIMAQLGE